MINLDLSKIVDCEVDGIDRKDHPNYCDAYISEAWICISVEGNCFRKLTEKELDWLNNQSDFVYEQVQKWIY